MTEPRALFREEVIDRLARIIRDHLDESFRDAPPPRWAEAAADAIIRWHQPMLRDVLLAEAKAEARAAVIAEIRERVDKLPVHLRRNGWATPNQWVDRRAVRRIFDELAP